jgi:hypothetical protein
MSELEKPKHDIDPKTVSGIVAAGVAVIPLMAVSIVGGAANLLRGHSFDDGFENTFDAAENAVGEALKRAVDLAEEHNDTILKGALKGAAHIVGGRVAKTFLP